MRDHGHGNTSSSSSSSLRLPRQYSELGYGSDDTGFESHLGKDIFLLPKTSRHSPRPTPASSTMDTRVISHGKSGRSVKLTNHLHPGPRLKMSGAIPLLPPYAFLMECTGTFYLYPRHAEFAKSGGFFFFYRRNCASFYVFFRTHFRFVTGLHNSIQYLVKIYILQSSVFTQVRRLRNTHHMFQAMTRN